MQLKVIISGTFHAIALLHLTRPAIKRLQQQRGESWRTHLGLMAVGPNRKRLLRDFLQDGGYTPKVNVLRQGMHLQAKHFGIEILANDCEESPEQINSKQAEIQLLPLLKGFGEDDLLGVFQLQADASLTCAWEIDTPFSGESLQLQLENFGRVLNVEERYDIIHGLTYADAQPATRQLENFGKSRMLKHIFHVPRSS
ncbi:hypothetical protein [Paucidesulfovibrio longus]|uniref:hypothetical protein n=1 Tax=Paucidesulfovibrio longus TaxID=889 RepID=UPI0003B44A12|nr:hypothetical protein [Paucidesulfovibrio longus]